MFGSSSQLSADVVDVESLQTMGAHKGVIALPPDGLCFYHAYNAAQNIEKWSSLPLQKKEEAAHATKQKMLSLIYNDQDAARLAGDGPESYPVTDDFKYLSALLKVERGLDMSVSYMVDGGDDIGPIQVWSGHPVAFSSYASQH